MFLNYSEIIQLRHVDVKVGFKSLKIWVYFLTHYSLKENNRLVCAWQNAVWCSPDSRFVPRCYRQCYKRLLDLHVSQSARNYSDLLRRIFIIFNYTIFDKTFSKIPVSLKYFENNWNICFKLYIFMKIFP